MILRDTPSHVDSTYPVVAVYTDSVFTTHAWKQMYVWGSSLHVAHPPTCMAEKENYDQVLLYFN